MSARLLLKVLGITVAVVTWQIGVPARQHPSGAEEDRPLFSSESALVVLHVTVKDAKGRYVSGLGEDAFAVFEDRQPQDIRLFTTQDAPVTVGLVIDNSGSMQGNQELMIAAAAGFVKTSNPQDDVFALAFNEHVRAALPAETPFTSSVSVLKEALAGAMTTRGRTALYDALAGGLKYAAAGRHERKVLVVVSDGGDNASQVSTFDEILAETQASNVVIYAVGLLDPVDRDGNPKRLKALAEASGGEAFFPRDARRVADVLEHMARDIRNSYTIAYAPANGVRDGSFHRIQVVVNAPGVKQPSVRTRAGYRAAAAEQGTAAKP